MPQSKHQVPGRVRSAYEFIKAHRDQYSRADDVLSAILRSAVKWGHLHAKGRMA